MAECVYLITNPSWKTSGCSSKKHPGFNFNNGWAYFGVWNDVPLACKTEGVNCPVFNNELKESQK